MAFQYYTDTPVRPYNLARVVAPLGANSAAEKWDFKSGGWRPSPGLAFQILWSGEWEPLEAAGVEDVQSKIRDFYTEGS